MRANDKGEEMETEHTCKTVDGVTTFAARITIGNRTYGYCEGCEYEDHLKAKEEEAEAQLGEIEAEFIMSWVNGGGRPEDARLAMKQIEAREAQEEAERKFQEQVSRLESEELAKVEKNLQKKGIIY